MKLKIRRRWEDVVDDEDTLDDDAMAALSSLSRLRWLDINGHDGVTDDGGRSLMRLENLEQLGIDGTGISAKVTAELMVKLKKLRWICFDTVCEFHSSDVAVKFFRATSRVKVTEVLDG